MWEPVKVSDISVADNPEFIQQVIADYQVAETPRIEKLNRYYSGKHDILNRTMEDRTKPNNKIVHPFGTYITNTVNGYFMGAPVTYTSDDETLMATLRDVLQRNDESHINAQHSKQASVAGWSAELVYMNENNDIRFAQLDTKDLVLIYDDSIDPEIIGAVRFYASKDYVSSEVANHAELYTKEDVVYYIEGKDGFYEADRKPHYFKDVPVVVYRNNAELIGDWERLIPLFDAYDKAVSDHSNMLEYFSDCYLVLTGLTAEPEDITAMKENRVMLLGENGKAEFLVKSADVQTLETYKVRLERDIHKFAQVADMQAEGFTSDLSGIAIRYKLMALEQLAVTKERHFKKALQKRIKLITNILNTKGQSFNYTDLALHFERNLPVNLAEKITSVKELFGIVSEQTLLSQLPFVDNVQAEMERKKAESELSNDYANLSE
jgi:SPP1 family phage portal protein